MGTSTSDSASKSGVLRTMSGRDPNETHRAATPLELLYDLCFVVAIAQAAHSLHHEMAHHPGMGAIASYAMVFFAIWWAWMGFTWFASAFDTDDPLYRLKVFVQMCGVLVIAAGVPKAFGGDFSYMVSGYVIMRVGLVAQWLRVLKASPEYRKTAVRYVIGIIVCQLGWIVWLAFPSAVRPYFFPVFLAMELLVPAWGEAARNTPWHPDHIAERYGLLTIIVIGEAVLASMVAVQKVIDLEHPDRTMVGVVFSAPVILFTMWWLYFLVHGATGEKSGRQAFFWGYVHYFIFASAAAVGAGIGLLVDYYSHDAHVSGLAASLSLAVSVAIYLICLPFHMEGRVMKQRVLPRVAGALCLAAAWLPWAAVSIATILCALTAYFILFCRKEHEHAEAAAT